MTAGREQDGYGSADMTTWWEALEYDHEDGKHVAPLLGCQDCEDGLTEAELAALLGDAE